jgi:hypothetical protein
MCALKAPGERVEHAAEELYRLPLADFTKARDARARDLRREGLRGEADAVKALRKPNLAAWAINLLARRHPENVRRLLEVGSQLREAQEALIAGGGREALDRAAEEERRLVARLTHDATAIAGEASTHGTGALEERIRGTLHAAALDEHTAAAVAAGRLVRDTEAVGLFGAKTPPAPRRPAAKAPPAPKRRGPVRKDEAARRRAAQELKTARADEEDARRAHVKAVRAAERAQKVAREAERLAGEARTRAEEARTRLREARRVEKAAAGARDRAARALAKAEQNKEQRARHVG